MLIYFQGHTFLSYIPQFRAREDELLYVLRKLRELRLWPGSLWAALSDDPTKYCSEQPPLGPSAYSKTTMPSSLTSKTLILDAVNRSSVGHLFKFYTLLCEIASVPRRTPEAWVHIRPASASIASRYSEEQDPKVEGRIDHQLEHLDARSLAKECLKIIGSEMGVS